MRRHAGAFSEREDGSEFVEHRREGKGRAARKMNPPSEPQKRRRRIVPQQITSPTKNTQSIAHALSCPINVDLREQSRKGRELGPGRKLWVDLKPYQNEKRQVNWKRLLDAQASVNGEGAAGSGAVGAVRAVGAVGAVGAAPEDGVVATAGAC